MSKGKRAFLLSVNKRRYPIHRIKAGVSYDTAEVARLIGVHRNTVRQWLKGGLRVIDAHRPLLIHGRALKDFLAEKQEARRQTCAIDELFCFRCRAPRRPWGGLADVVLATDKIARATALCIVCETTMHRTLRCVDVPIFKERIEASNWQRSD